MKTKTKEMIKAIFIIGVIIFLVWIISAESGETNVEFSLANTQPSCQFNAEGDVSYWVWWDPDPIPDGTIFREEVGIPIPPKFSCYRVGGWPSWGCCPDDIQCNPPTAAVPVDIRNQCYNFAPDVCSDYNEYSDPEYYCKAFNINTAIRSVEKFTGIIGICSGNYFITLPDDTIPERTDCSQYTSNCRCYWNETEEKCESKSTSYIFCNGEFYSEGNCTQGRVIKEDNCIEKGLITYIWEAIWEDSMGAPKPLFCNSGNKTFSCNMIRLSFFTFMNIVLFVLIVMIIYYYKNKKMEKKNKDE